MSASYGFRPKRSANNALEQAAEYVRSGHKHVVDIDLAKIFDEVNHDRLLWLLGTRIGDKRVQKLIGLYLKAGLMEDGLSSQRSKGRPQGGPLSALLSNIVLDELDKELERRRHSFVRYAEDFQIFVMSEAAALRVLSSLSDYINEKLRLKVNTQKSGVRKCSDVNLLGYRLLNEGFFGLSESSEKWFKDKVREITGVKASRKC